MWWQLAEFATLWMIGLHHWMFGLTAAQILKVTPAGKFLFNVMSGRRKVLSSTITETSSPWEVEPLMWDLKKRGVDPKVAYVDDECCGAWPTLLQQVWPAVLVRLDGFHAITRLTQTTASTQHPWHGLFCSMLSEAIYTYHSGEISRLNEARVRDGLKTAWPRGLKSKHIPRVICNAPLIFECVDKVVQFFKDHVHEEKGALLTQATCKAWSNLQKHVKSGCLCDPPGIEMNIIDETKNVKIGGEIFPRIRTMRGSSALEGLHCHQHQWLGQFSHHAERAGLAILADGTLRWNRKRHNEDSFDEAATPLVFRGGLLQDVNGLHEQLVGKKLYPNLTNASAAASPIASFAGKAETKNLSSMKMKSQLSITHDASNLSREIRAKQQSDNLLPAPMEYKVADNPGQHKPAAEIHRSEHSDSVLPAGDAVTMPRQIPESLARAEEKDSEERAQEPAMPSRGGCRKCRMRGTRCRLYDRIQWCETHDVPFDTWIVNVYPKKKEASKAATAKKAARVGGKRGRPKKNDACNPESDEAL